FSMVTSLRSCSRFALISASIIVRPVTFPPGRARLSTSLGTARHDDGDGRGRPNGGADGRRHIGGNDIRLEPDQLRGQSGQAVPVQLVSPVDDEVPSFEPNATTRTST